MIIEAKAYQINRVMSVEEIAVLNLEKSKNGNPQFLSVILKSGSTVMLASYHRNNQDNMPADEMKSLYDKIKTEMQRIDKVKQTKEEFFERAANPL